MHDFLMMAEMVLFPSVAIVLFGMSATAAAKAIQLRSPGVSKSRVLIALSTVATSDMFTPEGQRWFKRQRNCFLAGIACLALWPLALYFTHWTTIESV